MSGSGLNIRRMHVVFPGRQILTGTKVLNGLSGYSGRSPKLGVKFSAVGLVQWTSKAAVKDARFGAHFTQRYGVQFLRSGEFDQSDQSDRAEILGV